MNIMFVCLGNVCRSPIVAEILKKKYTENNIQGKVQSAGFEPHNINEKPDENALKEATKRGLDISSHTADLFKSDYFDQFDSIYVMDSKNMKEIKYFARTEADLKKVDYIMNLIDPGTNKALPDPLCREIEKADEIFELMNKACDKIIENVLRNKQS